MEAALHHHHYLGYRSRVGQNLQYWVRDCHDRPLGCVVFGAAAWKCSVRDHWIGRSPSARARQLGQILNNTRFVLFSWVRVAHLANSALSQIRRRVQRDWQAKYGQPIWLLETFVDRQRFGGACYRAAYWIYLGQTCGRGRQGPTGQLSTFIKDVYVLPLHSNVRDHVEQRQGLAGRPVKAARPAVCRPSRWWRSDYSTALRRACLERPDAVSDRGMHATVVWI